MLIINLNIYQQHFLMNVKILKLVMTINLIIIYYILVIMKII